MLTISQGKVNPNDIAALIYKSLPDQGSIEVQRDVPGKEHVWHTHATDETIVVLDGALRFYSEAGERLCLPGDVIALPAGTPHGSEALKDGAVYVIAFNTVAL